MGDLEHQRALVVAGARPGLLADDREPSQIARLVFDVGGQHIQPVVHAGLHAGDRRRARLVLGQLGGRRGAGDFDRARGGQVLGQPVAALRQGLRLAVDLVDFVARHLPAEL